MWAAPKHNFPLQKNQLSTFDVPGSPAQELVRSGCLSLILWDDFAPHTYDRAAPRKVDQYTVSDRIMMPSRQRERAFCCVARKMIVMWCLGLHTVGAAGGWCKCEMGEITNTHSAAGKQVDEVCS